MSYSYYLFLLLIIFFSLTGCTLNESDRKESAAESQTETVSKLRIMGHWYGEGKKELLVREAVREFSLLNQDMEISLEFPQKIFRYNDESELYFIECDSIAQMIRKNEWPWDILFLDQERYRLVSEYVNDPDWGSKYLIDFSKEAWFEATHKKELISGEFKQRYGGTIPGPVLEGVSDILFVSGEVEKKLGIKVKELDMTFSDFMQYARAVFEYNRTHSDQITFFSTQFKNGPHLLFTQLVLSMAGENRPATVKESLNILEKAYGMIESMAKYQPIRQTMDVSGIAYDKAQRILYHDKCLFVLQPTWMYLLWYNTNPSGTVLMRPCELPSADNCRSQYYPGFFQTIFVAPKNSKNPGAAGRFIKFLSSGEIADKWMRYSKCPTALKNNISYSDFGQTSFDIYFRHIQDKYKNNQKEIDLSWYLFDSPGKVSFFENEVLNGQYTAQTALQNISWQMK